MTQRIETIRKRFPKEWLLIRVRRFDEATTTPLTGRLLAHSQDRDLIFRKSISLKGHIMIDHAHSGRLPKGYAVAL
jgi:hypothetical protein